MMMKERHAYLILAHTDFMVLKELVGVLDDYRNDIYIHFDRKVIDPPILEAKYSKLLMLEDRVDVRWGDISMLYAEYNLFETAYKADNYSYFHLISGNHFPLFNQDYLHDFFARCEKNILMKMETSEKEIDLKFRKYNFFIKNFNSKNIRKKIIVQFFWHVLIKLQYIVGIKRNKDKQYYKASQWLSLKKDIMELVIKNKSNILKNYIYTLCSDEFFIPTLLENLVNRKSILYYDQLLKCEFVGPNTKTYAISDFNELIESKCLFVRKIDDNNMGLISKIRSNYGVNYNHKSNE
ncbi:glycosyltransferase [Elizabethkingia anophelis]|uniref:beta-1,6-N-acetylglucosaminyltransferase n=2 Tax=Weeksellaceae TaxID=2762318 RepID=UPI000739872E|nr:beta-1,6-N-acetylglucosaminyltransferase [Elizabethkingia anophelis]KUF46361.1 glycosyltransferase [Elizabethkingia anophelis]MCT3643455.1 glycosyltransferase [Elizabethkingia anophelis]MCT3650293.1 glycosyltransferase [Elizabethkingia anophelis]MCT3653910.1 glycosyltransferase [Elizabethkingia anophelis]MCT3657709.1 glycosyltransferase [Elizabethkingia anophelis]